MKPFSLQTLTIPEPVRQAYRGLRAGGRSVRATGNKLLNCIDSPVIVLVYHRVTTLPEDPERIAVSPENFRRQIEYLKQHVPILRFEDDWSACRVPAVVITFDDGYADNLLQALPILEAAEVPATFFVSTAHLGTRQVFWWHRLEAALLGNGPRPAQFALRDVRFGRTWPTASREQRADLYARLSMLMRGIDVARQEDWLGQLELWAGIEDPGADDHRVMSYEELQRLGASPWATVGAHTVSHVALSSLSAARQREEIFVSKQTLQSILGREITTFSYPFGRRSEYNRMSRTLCRQAGFVKAAANFPGQVHRWTDPLQLPRHLVRNWDLATFTYELKGFWSR
jgi:peptidoglycan/xylan/chitin deacetylase (PgdA/CDA1 family)